MIWPFRRRKANTRHLDSLMPDLIEVSAEQWLAFTRTSSWNQPGPLSEKIAFFARPAIRGLRQNVRGLEDCQDSALLQAIALGIVRSGTHSEVEVKEALGGKLSGK